MSGDGRRLWVVWRGGQTRVGARRVKRQEDSRVSERPAARMAALRVTGASWQRVSSKPDLARREASVGLKGSVWRRSVARAGVLARAEVGVWAGWGGIGVGRFGTLGRGGRALGEQCGEGSGQRGDATGDVGHERLRKGFILPVRQVWAGRGRYSVGDGKRMQVFAVDVVDGRVEAICQWWGGEGTVGNRDRAVL